jgi:hypothetical protein
VIFILDVKKNINDIIPIPAGVKVDALAHPNRQEFMADFSLRLWGLSVMIACNFTFYNV